MTALVQQLPTPTSDITTTPIELQAVMDDILASGLTKARRLGGEIAELWEVAIDRIGGGKLLRPLLLIQTAEALQPQRARLDRSALLRIAAGVELLHYAFVLHDDVIDGDLQRRHRSNLMGALRDQTSHLPANHSAHWANTAGILMGDLMLSQAQRIWASEPMPWPIRERLLDLLDDTITVSVAGELTDVALADGLADGDLATVLEMCRRKTGAYTVELPLRAAAIIAGLRPDDEAILGQIGRRIGLAYQLQDDLLSTFGDADEHGKDAWSDLREGKQTAVIALARQHPLWKQIAAKLSPPVGLDQARSARDLLVAAGTDRLVQDLIDDEFASCLSLAQQAPPQARPIVAQLVEQLRGRQS